MQPENNASSLPTEPVLPTQPVMPNEVAPVNPAYANPEPIPAPVPQPATEATQPPVNAPSPMVAPVAPISTYQNNPLGLAIAGLVLGLLFPPLGLLLALVAVKKADSGTSGKMVGVIGAILSGLGTLLLAVAFVYVLTSHKTATGSTFNASAGTNSGASAQSADQERVSDVKAIFTQLELNFDKVGYYPTLAQLNDPSWRTKNLPQLDAKALQDPAGSGAFLTGAPQANAYAYEPTGNQGQACNNVTVKCLSYKLEAVTSDEKAYIKTSLN